MKKHIKANVSWVGHTDWELKFFHGDDYSTLNGSSQNAYLVEEEKTVLIDTVWIEHNDDFVHNLKEEVDLNKIDYIIINHGEADHAGALAKLMEEIPNTPIYCTANAVKSLEGQYGKHNWNFNIVKTGDSLDIGNGKKLIFVEMRMLHWPDSMATYLTEDNILFSNDAFGQHFAVEELFNDKANQCNLEKEALKYYANILAPLSPLVTKKIEEIVALNIPIDIIAPSHGVVWRDNPMQIVENYAKWADNYKEDQVTIVYDTMYEGTAKIAYKLAQKVNELSPDTAVKVFNCAKVDKNEIMTEIFKSKAIAVGSSTIGNNILSSVAGWLHFLRYLKLKDKKATAFGCYGWSGEGNKIIKQELAAAGFEVIDEEIKSLWNPDETDYEKLDGLVKSLLA